MKTVTKEDWKRKVIEAVEKRAGELQEIGETILHHPELGFKEVKTAAGWWKKNFVRWVCHIRMDWPSRESKLTSREGTGKSTWPSWENWTLSSSLRTLSPIR